MRKVIVVSFFSSVGIRVWGEREKEEEVKDEEEKSNAEYRLMAKRSFAIPNRHCMHICQNLYNLSLSTKKPSPLSTQIKPSPRIDSIQQPLPQRLFTPKPRQLQ
jgi:hypothetical protein